MFSERYVNRGAIGDNVLLLLMYRFAFPFSVLLNKFRITPNQITTLSIIFSILALLSLLYDEGWKLFVFCWGMSLLLDFCDGTVARMTGNIRKTAFRYDHISDLFKIFIVILAAGLRYDTQIVWLLSLTASFFFMYYMVLNHELNSVIKQLEKDRNGQQENSSGKIKSSSLSFVEKLIKNDSLLKLIKSMYLALVTINGHTLLLFLILPFGPEWAVAVLAYFTCISMFGAVKRIAALQKTPR